jgi:hypothetical protein
MKRSYGLPDLLKKANCGCGCRIQGFGPTRHGNPDLLAAHLQERV